MNWTTEEFVEWLATDEDASFELPDGMTGNDFLRYWIQLGDDPSSHFVRLSPDEVELKVAAIAAAPTTLEAASRATSGHCMGCLMFWEDLAGVRRTIEGGRQIWDAIGEALRAQQAAAPDDCMEESAKHGLEHYAQTEAEGW